MRVGIDIEQYLRDPYGSGIQRVIQQLAQHWPLDVPADFLIPDPENPDVFLVLPPPTAYEFISLAFEQYEGEHDIRNVLHDFLSSLSLETTPERRLLETYDCWLLPEVSYLPSVLERVSRLRQAMRTVMIGYDTLPMTEPTNYRFKPGMAGWVSQYFRLLATADAVVCISDYARESITTRLRRDPGAFTTVAHPGGDHLPVRTGNPPDRPRFVRLGTLEARKQPMEILHGFMEAVDQGLEADLLFVGRHSASDEGINQAIRNAIARGYPVQWIEGASDAQVHDLVNASTVFLSIGVEGYGIPVLESIRLGTPVVFSGTQPAASLMVNRGAFRINDVGSPSLSSTLRNAATDGPAMAMALAPEDVPSWSNFVRHVLDATRNTR